MAGQPTLRRFISLVLLGSFAQPTLAQEPDEPLNTGPKITVHYEQLLDRQPFRFITGANDRYTKPVGRLRFRFADGEFGTEGLDGDFLTYCAEPLTPIYAGRDYTFTIEPFGKPSDFGLPNTEAGRAEAERRAGYVRELYGRFYTAAAANPELKAPAFQTALWELLHETEFPDGPMPFNLSTGTFQAAPPVGEAVPEFVTEAQSYLQELTGDDAVFNDNTDLFGYELIRLEDVEEINGVAIQAQLLLRSTPLAASANLGGISGLGSLGGAGGGVGPGFGYAGAPLVGTGGGGGGVGGGSGGPVRGLVPPPAPGLPNVNGNGPPSPQIGEEPPGNPPSNPPENPPEFPPKEPPSEEPPERPPVDPPVDPVPAPPGVVLGLFGGAILLVRRYRSKG